MNKSLQAINEMGGAGSLVAARSRLRPTAARCTGAAGSKNNLVGMEDVLSPSKRRARATRLSLACGVAALACRHACVGPYTGLASAASEACVVWACAWLATGGLQGIAQGIVHYPKHRAEKKVLAEKRRREALWKEDAQQAKTRKNAAAEGGEGGEGGAGGEGGEGGEGAGLDTSTDERFEVDDPRMLEHLEREGYVVVKAALEDAGQIRTAERLLWEFLEENVPGMHRTDADTWTNRNFATVGDIVTGIVHGAGFGHSAYCWYCRRLPRVARAFAAVWGRSDGDLIVSFDGGNVFRPFHRPFSSGGATGGDHFPISKTSGGWWHIDQGRTKRGKQCVQGLVTLRAANRHTGGLCVVPRSHLQHDTVCSYAAVSDGDFVPMPPHDPLVAAGKLVVCEAGDLVLWDSRTVHCNSPALVDPVGFTGWRSSAGGVRPLSSAAAAAAGAAGAPPPGQQQAPPRLPTDQLIRAAVYVCMTPRALASKAVLRARREAFVAAVGSSHWPHAPRFAPTGGAMQAELKAMSEAELARAMNGRGADARQCALVG
jgi:hypothetical protein